MENNNTPRISCKSQFISILIQGETPVTVFLTNGVKLSGVITTVFQQDAYEYTGIILSRDGVSQMVEQHAIATIMPSHHG